MQDLYCSRKGNGSLQIELDSLRQDNERLLALLKETCEYGDMDDDQIQNAAMRTSMLAKSSVASAKSKKSSMTDSTQGGPKGSVKEAKNNDWIPT